MLELLERAHTSQQPVMQGAHECTFQPRRLYTHPHMHAHARRVRMSVPFSPVGSTPTHTCTHTRAGVLRRHTDTVRAEHETHLRGSSGCFSLDRLEDRRNVGALDLRHLLTVHPEEEARF